MKFRYLLTAAGAVALAACGSEEAATEAPTEAVETATTTAAAEAPAAGSPQQFVDQAAASDTYEVEAAKLAQENGESQKVKDFAAMMIKDHTTSSEKLKAAAAEAQPPLTVAPELAPDQQANLDALRNAAGDFDTVYAQQQVAAHEKALALLRSYGEAGEVAPLKTFASETAQVVEGHLEQARQLP